MMKKVFVYLCMIICFIMIRTIDVKASDNAMIVASYSVEADANSYLVPVEIKNNPGLMGFKISVSYGDGVIINSISRGTVTSRGTFADNHILNGENNYFDVIWNYTEEIKKDGELFIIGLSVNTSIKDEIRLSISYSSSDTFNEVYENVLIECDDIVLKETEKYDSAKHNEYISDAIEENNVGIIANVINDQDIVSIVDNTMKTEEIRSPDKISSEGKKKIIDEVIQSILESDNHSDTIEEISDDLADDKIYEIIKETYDQQQEQIDINLNVDKDSKEDTGQNKNKGNKNNIKPLMILIVIIFVAIRVGLLLKRERTKK